MKKLYLQAFPKSERKPFRLMRKKAREGVMELLVIHEKKELLGLAITARYKDMVLLDYFAVETGHRGKKIGSCALELLKQRYKDCRFMLEIELPETEGPGQDLRIRRKQFYLRNGMKETGIKVCLFLVPMELLTDGKAVSFEEYYALYEHTIGPAFARKVERLAEKKGDAES